MKKTLITISVFSILMGIAVFIAMDIRGGRGLGQISLANQSAKQTTQNSVNIQKNASTVTVIDKDKLPTKIDSKKDYPVIQSAPDSEINSKSTEMTSSLNEIKTLLLKMDTRITELERDIESVRIVQRSYPSQSNTTANEPIQEDELLTDNIDDDDRAPTAEQIQKQLEKEQYYIALEQDIFTEADPIVSDDISNRYAEMFKSREDWSSKVTLDSSECGGKYCKVVVSYDDDLDKLSEFELDGMLFMPTTQDYPLSKSRYSSKPDGSKQVTIYFVAKGNQFPAEQG